MNAQTIIRAIGNLPAEARERLMSQISGLIIGALAGKTEANRRRIKGRKVGELGTRRPAGSATEQEVLEHISANPGQRTEEIASALGGNVKAALKKLREGNMVRTKGQKRAMTYSAADR